MVVVWGGRGGGGRDGDGGGGEIKSKLVLLIPRSELAHRSCCGICAHRLYISQEEAFFLVSLAREHWAQAGKTFKQPLGWMEEGRRSAGLSCHHLQEFSGHADQRSAHHSLLERGCWENRRTPSSHSSQHLSAILPWLYVASGSPGGIGGYRLGRLRGADSIYTALGVILYTGCRHFSVAALSSPHTPACNPSSMFCKPDKLTDPQRECG